MPKNLIDFIRTHFEQNELFQLEDVTFKDKTLDAIKMDLTRFVKDGEIKRLSYGLYYVPSPTGNNAPGIAEGLDILYLHKGNSYYGYYTGNQYVNYMLHNPMSPNEPIEIMTNKATSGKKVIHYLGHTVTLRKPYFTIKRENVEMGGFLTYLAMSTPSEIKTNTSVLANFIRTNHLSADDVMSLAPYLPAKTMTRLLASDLYRSLWKH